MSDERWRPGDTSGDPDTDEFGGPLFPDEPTDRPGTSDDTGERRLSFGPNDTGPLPHWTDPPTGEIPRVAPQASGQDPENDDDVDVWSQFTTETPVWRDDEPSTETVAPSGSGAERDATGEVRADSVSEPSGEFSLAPRRRPPRTRAHHHRHRPVRRAAPAAAGDAAAPSVRAAALRPAGRTGAHGRRHDRVPA